MNTFDTASPQSIRYFFMSAKIDSIKNRLNYILVFACLIMEIALVDRIYA